MNRYIIALVVVLLNMPSAVSGETWTHFTGDNVSIPLHTIDMAVDHDNVLWVGNWYGLWSYDGAAWNTWWLFENGECVVSYPGDEPLPSGGIIAIAVDLENVKWITVPRGVVRFDGNTWEFIQREEDAFISAAVDHNNVKWFGTFGTSGGVWSFDGVTWTNYPDADGVSLEYVYGITVDSNNTKWFTYNHDGGTVFSYGIARLENASWNTQVLDRGGEWMPRAHAIAADADNVIWVGGDGITTVENTDMTAFTKLNELDGCVVYDIIIGPDNTKWFGTGDNGVSSFNGSSWATCDSTNGLPDNQVVAIAIDSNNVKWFGTKTGVSRLEGTPLQVEESPFPAPLTITGNYPNPFNPETTIEFSLDADMGITLDIHDITGQLVKTIADSYFPAGIHTAVWDGTDDTGAAVSSGVYFCRMRAGGRTVVRRMALVR